METGLLVILAVLVLLPASKWFTELVDRFLAFFINKKKSEKFT